METGESPDSVTIEPVEQQYRWAVVIVYGLLNTVIGINTVNVPPIATTLVSIYGVSSFLINIIAIIYLVMFAIINLPANYFIDDHGIKVGLWIGSILLTIGNAFQMLVNVNFSFMIVGSVFIATAQPFINNCAAKIATFWFFKQNRTNVVTILTLVNLIGTGIGFVLPTLLVDQNPTSSLGMTEVFNLQLVQFLLALISCVLIMIFMKDKPENPPSLGSKTQKIAFKQSIHILMGNKNFIKLFFGYFLFLGPLNTFGALLNFLLKPYNFTNIQISIFGVILLVAGLLGSIAATLFVSKTLKYTLTHKILTIISIITVVVTILQLNFFNVFGLFLFLIFVLGFFITPLYPLGSDFGCQIAFPVGEAQITGLLTGGGFICSLILILILQLGVGFGTTAQSTVDFVVFIGMMFVGGLVYWTIQNDLRRRNLEDQQKIKEKPVEIELISPPPKQSPDLYNKKDNQLTMEVL